MQTAQEGTSEVAIFGRVLELGRASLSVAAARSILALDFAPTDKDRMRELSAKARAGTLTVEEDAEAGKYELVGHLLSIMQSKSRRSLKGHRGEGEESPRTH